jgi:hypothetical protein
MMQDRVKRALRSVIEAQYCLADGWFATKSIFELTGEQALHAIVRMEKGKMKYCLTVNSINQRPNAANLYRLHVKGQ